MACLASNSADTIGKPLPNYLCYVVHPNGSLCPPNVYGELWVGGPGVSSEGYLNRPELTAEKFIENPFGGGKVYRTGDRVKWNLHGEIVFGGRFDDQVKVRGFRIELGEVENCVCEFGAVFGVVQCVAVVKNANLYAYVSPGNIPVDKVLKSLAAKIPKHMVPAGLLAVEKFHTTPNGKIDKKALPEPDGKKFGGTSAVVEYVAPRNPEEVKMCEQWSKLLNLQSPPGVEDNFFQLGGHSLLAMKLAQFTGFSVATLMGYPTVAGVLRSPEALSGRAGAQGSFPKAPSDFFLAANAEGRMLAVHLSDPASTAYHMPIRIGYLRKSSCTSEQDARRLVIQKMHSLFDQDPHFRLRFTQTGCVSFDGARPAIFNLPTKSSISTAELLRPFDLLTGPLFRYGVGNFMPSQFYPTLITRESSQPKSLLGGACLESEGRGWTV